MKKLSDFVKLFKEPFVPATTNPTPARRTTPALRNPPLIGGAVGLRSGQPYRFTEARDLREREAELQDEATLPLGGIITEQPTLQNTAGIGWQNAPGATGPATLDSISIQGATGPIGFNYDASTFNYDASTWKWPSENTFITSQQMKEKPMSFDGLTQENKVAHIKQEYNSIIKCIFEHPETLKQLVVDKKLSNKQAKEIFAVLNTANTSVCGCCRIFDPKKLKTPLNPELEPLIDLAQEKAKAKYR
jgi:hypothetical protein